MQTTVGKPIMTRGVGLHKGQSVTMRIEPAPAGSGIVFLRADLGFAPVPALWDNVQQSTLMTRLASAAVEVCTIEHVMAALAGCGVRNARVVLDGPEAPIADGSSVDFVRAILDAGVVSQAADLQIIRILKPVEVRRGQSMARLEPFDGFEIEFSIAFDDPAIGTQAKRLNLANGAFVHELCDARTFCRSSDIDMMRAEGFALGGSLENAVVVDGSRILTPGGLRHRDEAVRHKMLDALGDLALAGAPILGRYVGVRAGHSLTNTLLRALFLDPEAWDIETCTPDVARCLPGAGVVPEDLLAVA